MQSGNAIIRASVGDVPWLVGLQFRTPIPVKLPSLL
jgi:hypothetical protein